MSDLETDWFEYRGLRIRYAHRPGKQTKLPLLMFNGIGQSVEALQPLIGALQDMPIITYDVPGVGLSDVPKMPWRYKHHARLAAELVRHLGYEKVNVFGLSWGGGLAQQFVLQYPALSKKLILAASVPGCLGIPGSPKVYSKMLSPRRFTNKSYMGSISGDLYGGDFRNDSSLAQQMISLQEQPPTIRGYLYQISSMHGWTRLPILRRLKQPTLILHGEDDPMIPKVNAQLMARLIKKSRLELIDCGHLFVLTRIDVISPMIRKFVSA